MFPMPLLSTFQYICYNIPSFSLQIDCLKYITQIPLFATYKIFFGRFALNTTRKIPSLSFGGKSSSILSRFLNVKKTQIRQRTFQQTSRKQIEEYVGITDNNYLINHTKAKSPLTCSLDGNIYFTIVEKDRYIQEAKETGIDSNNPHISSAPREKVA